MTNSTDVAERNIHLCPLCNEFIPGGTREYLPGSDNQYAHPSCLAASHVALTARVTAAEAERNRLRESGTMFIEAVHACMEYDAHTTIDDVWPQFETLRAALATPGVSE